MNVADNMSFNLMLSGASKESIRERVGEAARMLDLTSLLERGLRSERQRSTGEFSVKVGESRARQRETQAGLAYGSGYPKSSSTKNSMSM
jgi:ABC-type sugar transport system ATPase subunit